MKVRLLTLLILAGCVNHDVGNPPKNVAVNAACDRCDRSASEMFWFSELIDKAEREPASRGSIYIAAMSNTVVFIHQPIIASCLACLVYDCDGNRLTLSHEQLQQVASQMTHQNMIYSTSLE